MYAIGTSNLHYRFVRNFCNAYVDVKINYSTTMLQKILVDVPLRGVASRRNLHRTISLYTTVVNDYSTINI